MQLEKMKYTVVILLFITLIETALTATCTYYRSSNEITCGSVTCRTGGQEVNYQLGITTSVIMATKAPGSSFIGSNQLEGIGTTIAGFQNWDVVEDLLYTLEHTVEDASPFPITVVTTV